MIIGIEILGPGLNPMNIRILKSILVLMLKILAKFRNKMQIKAKNAEFYKPHAIQSINRPQIKAKIKSSATQPFRPENYKIVITNMKNPRTEIPKTPWAPASWLKTL